jgi:hypothetical protein
MPAKLYRVHLTAEERRAPLSVNRCLPKYYCA